jgi:hypothetical protein
MECRKSHEQERKRPPGAVQFRSAFHDKPAGLIESARRRILLVDIDRQLTAKSLCVLNQCSAAAAPLELCVARTEGSQISMRTSASVGIARRMFIAASPALHQRFAIKYRRNQSRGVMR